MKTNAITSHADLRSRIAGLPKAFLLLYKEGAEQSDCALQRIRDLKTDPEASVFTVEVTSVRDVHTALGVDSAPSLVIFRNGQPVNIVKGCLTASSYASLIEGREIGSHGREEGKKAKRVTVYTTPTCSWCRTIKTYLDGQGIRYREINVAADQKAAEEMVRKSGQQGVPQTDIDGQVVVGFDKNRINQLLEIA
ncbi:MAG: glutaredoxin domain-containing protein [Bacteroidales bacterium]